MVPLDKRKEDCLQGIAGCQQELDNRDISINLFPGQEVRIVGELMEDIYSK